MLFGVIKEKLMVNQSKLPVCLGQHEEGPREGMLMVAHQRAGLLVVYSEAALPQACSIV